MFNPGNKTGEAANTALLIYLTPQYIISLLFPLTIYVELIKEKFREKIEKILKKLDMFQEFNYTVEIKKIT